MRKSIAVLGTLDTRGEEFKYVKDMIERKGHKAIVIDCSSLGEPTFPPDIRHEEVAKAAGVSIKEVAALEEGEAIPLMAQGAAKIVKELHLAGRLHGMIAMGGSMGTWLGQIAMKALPLELPKLMVSTVAFTSFLPPIASNGQMLTNCIAGMWGLNTIGKASLDKAVAAIVGMAEAYEQIALEKPLIGITTIGSAATDYVFRIKPLIEERGYELAVFHTVGFSGGNAMEELIERGVITAVLDLCLMEIPDYLYGGWCSAGPNRLEAAGRKGIPQVVAPGGVEWVAWAGPPETLPPRLKDRLFHVHNPMDTLVALTVAEKAEVGRWIAQKLNQATGPTAVILPLGGFTKWGRPGGFFYNPDADRALIEALKQHIGRRIRVVEVDASINDPVFIETVIAIFDDMMKTA